MPLSSDRLYLHQRLVADLGRRILNECICAVKYKGFLKRYHPSKSRSPKMKDRLFRTYQ